MQTNPEIPRDFAGAQVIVTGGAGALGSAVVEHLVARGARCHVPVRGPVDGESPEGVVLTGSVDLTEESSVSAYYAVLPPIWASIHLAGGFAMAPIAKTTVAQLESMWRINALTCFLCMREAIARMRGSGGGRIVNVASRPAVTAAPSMSAYAASKAAVVSMTAGVAQEVVGDDILINAVAPSIIDTPANRAAMPTADHASWPKPSEIAAIIAALASPQNRLTTGATVPVYGKA